MAMPVNESSETRSEASQNTPLPAQTTSAAPPVSTEDTPARGAQAIHPMPEHFPEVSLDAQSGDVRIGTQAQVTRPLPQSLIGLDIEDTSGLTVPTPAIRPDLESGGYVPTVTVQAPPVQSTVISAPITPSQISRRSAPPTQPLPTYTPADADPYASPVQPRYQPERSVCVRCGSANLTKGYVVDFGDKFRHIHFAPKRMSTRRLNSLWTLRPFNRLARLDAVACRDCGAVLLTVDTDELRKSERRRREP